MTRTAAVKTDVYRNGRVHVKSALCDTCIFRPGNLMSLERGRVKWMTKTALAIGGTIPCHETIHRGGGEAVCRGFYDLKRSDSLLLAGACDVITFQD